MVCLVQWCNDRCSLSYLYSVVLVPYWCFVERRLFLPSYRTLLVPSRYTPPANAIGHTIGPTFSRRGNALLFSGPLEPSLQRTQILPQGHALAGRTELVRANAACMGRRITLMCITLPRMLDTWVLRVAGNSRGLQPARRTNEVKQYT